LIENIQSAAPIIAVFLNIQIGKNSLENWLIFILSSSVLAYEGDYNKCKSYF
jgi:hypothetical protein